MLNFIGNGSAFNTQLGNNSAYIKRDNRLFLIDCGSNIFNRLLDSNLLEEVEEIEVLITHFHPDHIGSLGDLIFYAHYILKARVIVHTPQRVALSSILSAMGITDDLYAINEIVIGETSWSLIFFDLAFEPIETTHDENLSCYGYVLRLKNPKGSEHTYTWAYYSGDSNTIPERAFKGLSGQRFDYFYQDTCSMDYEGNVHMSLDKLASLVKRHLRGYVYCMHLDSAFDRKYAESLGFNVTINIFDPLPDSLDSLFPPSPLWRK